MAKLSNRQRKKLLAQAKKGAIKQPGQVTEQPEQLQLKTMTAEKDVLTDMDRNQFLKWWEQMGLDQHKEESKRIRIFSNQSLEQWKDIVREGLEKIDQIELIAIVEESTPEPEAKVVEISTKSAKVEVASNAEEISSNPTPEQPVENPTPQVEPIKEPTTEPVTPVVTPVITPSEEPSPETEPAPSSVPSKKAAAPAKKPVAPQVDNRQISGMQEGIVLGGKTDKDGQVTVLAISWIGEPGQNRKVMSVGELPNVLDVRPMQAVKFRFTKDNRKATNIWYLKAKDQPTIFTEMLVQLENGDAIQVLSEHNIVSILMEAMRDKELEMNSTFEDFIAYMDSARNLDYLGYSPSGYVFLDNKPNA